MEPQLVYVTNPASISFALNWQGNWDNTTLYVFGQVVVRNGASYVARQAVPVNTDPLYDTTQMYWLLVAQGGAANNILTAPYASAPYVKSAANVNTSVAVTGSSTLVVASNVSDNTHAGRSQVWIYNNSLTEILYLSYGSPAVVGSGIRVNPNGAYHTTQVYQGAIYGITSLPFPTVNLP